jgi:hypothetical protein
MRGVIDRTHRSEATGKAELLTLSGNLDLGGASALLKE